MNFKLLLKLLLLAFTITFVTQGCFDRAKTNAQVLKTFDCGANWELIKTGESLGSNMGICTYYITVPNSPMAGEAKFRIAFEGNILAWIDINYQYIIEDPIKFINAAKYLGKEYSGADTEGYSDKLYESAENSLIEKNLADIAREMLITESVLTFSNTQFEASLLETANKKFGERGISFTFISFTPEYSDQTQHAIDVGTAINIFEKIGISKEDALEIIKSKAGASVITVETSVTPEKE